MYELSEPCSVRRKRALRSGLRTHLGGNGQVGRRKLPDWRWRNRSWSGPGGVLRGELVGDSVAKFSYVRKSSSCCFAQLNGLNAGWFDQVAELAQFPDHPLRALSFPSFDHRRTPFLITHLPVQKDPN